MSNKSIEQNITLRTQIWLVWTANPNPNPPNHFTHNSHNNSPTLLLRYIFCSQTIPSQGSVFPLYAFSSGAPPLLDCQRHCKKIIIAIFFFNYYEYYNFFSPNGDHLATCMRISINGPPISQLNYSRALELFF